jgi:ligand-binding sensor domain-containing protein
MKEGLSAPREDEQASIAQAPDGTMWTTGAQGTARFEDDRWVRIDDTPGQRLAVAPDGTVWVLEAGGGALTAWREEGSSWVAERHRAPTWLTLVDWMDVLPDGTVVTYQGESFPVLGRFDGTSWTKQLFRRVGGRPVEWLYAPDVDADGHVWILWSGPLPEGGGEPEFGTARLDGSDWTVFDVPVGWAHGLVAGPDGSLWLGSDDGLLRFDGSAWVPAGFQGSYVVPMGATADGAVWLTDGSGAMYRRPAG